jgi:hypothetical protein
METMLKEFCPYIVVLATLEKGGQGDVHVVREGAPAHRSGHAHTPAGLRRGLGGTPLTALALLAGWDT